MLNGFILLKFSTSIWVLYNNMCPTQTNLSLWHLEKPIKICFDLPNGWQTLHYNKLQVIDNVKHEKNQNLCENNCNLKMWIKVLEDLVWKRDNLFSFFPWIIKHGKLMVKFVSAIKLVSLFAIMWQKNCLLIFQVMFGLYYNC